MSGVVAWMLECVEGGEVERQFNERDQFCGGRTGGQPLVLQSDLAAAIARAEALEALLDEVRCCFTRDDALPDELLPRIDAAIAAQQAEDRAP